MPPAYGLRHRDTISSAWYAAPSTCTCSAASSRQSQRSANPFKLITRTCALEPLTVLCNKFYPLTNFFKSPYPIVPFEPATAWWGFANGAIIQHKDGNNCIL